MTETAQSETAQSEAAQSETAQSEAAKTLPAPTVWPTLQARDANALIDFYGSVFGFVATAVYADGDVVSHAQLDWPEGGGIMLGSYRPEQEWTREPGTFGAYVVTDRVDEIYARVQQDGVSIVRPVEDTDYGNREFAVQDPEGNLWSFGVYRGEPR